MQRHEVPQPLEERVRVRAELPAPLVAHDTFQLLPRAKHAVGHFADLVGYPVEVVVVLVEGDPIRHALLALGHGVAVRTALAELARLVHPLEQLPQMQPVHLLRSSPTERPQIRADSVLLRVVPRLVDSLRAQVAAIVDALVDEPVAIVVDAVHGQQQRIAVVVHKPVARQHRVGDEFCFDLRRTSEVLERPQRLRSVGRPREIMP